MVSASVMILIATLVLVLNIKLKDENELISMRLLLWKLLPTRNIALFVLMETGWMTLVMGALATPAHGIRCRFRPKNDCWKSRRDFFCDRGIRKITKDSPQNLASLCGQRRSPKRFGTSLVFSSHNYRLY